MQQKLVTIVVDMNTCGVSEHLEEYFHNGWRVVSTSVVSTGASFDAKERQPGKSDLATAMSAKLMGCVTVLLERSETKWQHFGGEKA